MGVIKKRRECLKRIVCQFLAMQEWKGVADFH